MMKQIDSVRTITATSRLVVVAIEAFRMGKANRPSSSRSHRKAPTTSTASVASTRLRKAAVGKGSSCSHTFSWGMYSEAQMKVPAKVRASDHSSGEFSVMPNSSSSSSSRQSQSQSVGHSWLQMSYQLQTLPHL